MLEVSSILLSDSTVESNDSDEVCDADCLGVSDSECCADELITEQRSDVSLAECWQQAKMNKGDFVISEGVLYPTVKSQGTADLSTVCTRE